MIPFAAVVAVTIATIVLGNRGSRFARTTSNFFVASRSVDPRWNAFAVCGEAMSAASYLGVPALILVFGVDMLWTLVGWTAGFLLLSLFIAAPVRRFGSYTLPEFAQGRLDSALLRPILAVMVVLASWFFFLAQLKGAGVVVRELVGTPYWVGVVAVGLIVAANLSSGGMRGITFVQGFQFFFIIAGILIPFAVLSVLWLANPQGDIVTDEVPSFAQATTVDYPTDVTIAIAEAIELNGTGSVDGRVVDGPISLAAGAHRIEAGTALDWPAGAAGPHLDGVRALSGTEWSTPFAPKDLGGGHPTYFAFAQLMASMFGIMSFPHIVVRFYTNPTGQAARRTALWVLALLAPYYAMLPLFGAIGRVLGVDLLGNGAADSTTVVVAQRISEGQASELIAAVVSAGAAAAFLSTSSGLLIVIAGAVSHDMLHAGVPQFRRVVWAGAIISIVVGLAVESININVLIGWATSIAAASICPILLLGIWWPGLTARGALASVVVGGVTTTGSVAATLLGVVESGWPLALLATPAVWSLPLAFAVAVGVSLGDPHKVKDVGLKFALMHLPERQMPKDPALSGSVTGNDAADGQGA